MGTDVTRRLYVGEIQAASNREVMTANYLNRHTLVAEARRLQQRGEIALIPGIRPRWSDEQREWQYPVYRVRQQRQARVSKTALNVFITLAGVALVIAAGAWFLTALTVGALIALCTTALVTLFIILRAGRPRVEVTTVTHTRVR